MKKLYAETLICIAHTWATNFEQEMNKQSLYIIT